MHRPSHVRVLVLASLVAVALVAGVTVRLFVRPSIDAVRKVDAVVLFAGGRGERLAMAERLMIAGVAPNLVLPNGLKEGWAAANRLCGEPQPFTVNCPDPDPDTTRGEARSIASLAQREGWNEILLVTSTFHVARARLALGRCFPGTVFAAAAHPGLGPVVLARRVAHEWGGWTRAQVLDREC